VEVEEQQEECDGVVREANSVGSRFMDHTRNENTDELGGKPVCELFSRGEFGQWERVLSFEAPQGEDAKCGGFGDDTASKEAADVFRL